MNTHFAPFPRRIHLVPALALAIAAVSATAAPPAHAAPDPYESLTYQLSEIATASATIIRQGGELTGTGPWQSASDCTAIITKLKDAGAKADDRLRRSFSADELFALGAIVHKDDRGSYILMKDAPSVCTHYAALKQALPAAKAMVPFARGLQRLADVAIEVVGPDFGSGAMAEAEKCAPALDAAIAAGAPTDVALAITSSLPAMTLDAARAQLCDAYVARAKTFAAAAEAARKAEFDRIAAPYIALGVKGDRLDLFVLNESSPFYEKGCQTQILDNKKLVKAKILFHWLDAPDGTITIRKYTIKGNAYSTSEKTYDRSSDAYKGCR